MFYKIIPFFSWLNSEKVTFCPNISEIWQYTEVILPDTNKAVQNKKRLSKKSTFCDDMLFNHRFQGNITS